MPELGQAAYMRGVRGETIDPGKTPKIENVVGAISSISRAAVRRVHTESPSDALAYFDGAIKGFAEMSPRTAATCSTYSQSLGRYIAWDGTADEADLDLKLIVPFSPDDRVRSIAHVVLDVGGDKREGRVLLWDELPLSPDAAEMIALPIVECVENVYGPESVAAIEVWHLALAEKERVERDAALARRPDVESFFSNL